MKILIVTDYYNKTGSGKQNYQLCQALRNLWHEAEMFNLVSPQGFKSVPDYGINVVASSFLKGVFWDFRRGLKKHLETHRYDCVFLGQHGLAYLHGTLKDVKQTSVLLLADLFPLDWRYTSRWDVRYWVYNAFLLRGFERFGNVVFISKYTQNEYLRKIWKLPTYSVVIHIGTPISEASAASGGKDWRSEFQGKPVVLQVGSFDRRKNAPVFFRIAERFFVRRGGDVVFARVGKTPADWSDRAPGNMRFFSGLSESDLFALYRYASVFVFTSLAEGYGMPIVEARSMGLPVVSTRVSDMAEIFADDIGTDFVDDPSDIETFESLIEKRLERESDKVVPKCLESLDVRTEAAKYADFFRNARSS